MNQFEQYAIKSAYKMMRIARIIKRNASLLQGSIVLTQKAPSEIVGVEEHETLKPKEANKSMYQTHIISTHSLQASGIRYL